MAAEERVIKLKHTKQRFTKEEYEQEILKPGVQPLTEEGNCGNYFIEIRGGHIYTCRWCHTDGPTYIYWKECIQLPD